MKNIQNYRAKKYETSAYEEVEENIYRGKCPWDEDMMYMTSLQFEQEPELGEGDSPKNISQYPLEDILDKFLVYITDFYEKENDESSGTCYLEFAGADIKKIQELRTIIGKHVYLYIFEEDGQEWEKTVIE